MKNLIQKVQDLSRKAAELKLAAQGVPGKAAEIRQAIVMSAGDLHQLRTEVQSNLNGLRANNEDRLLQAMREINDNTYTLEEAGYELVELDLDLSFNQRLAVHLRKFEHISHSTLRTLLSKETSEIIKSILAGIIKAEEIAANVELTHLKHDGVMVHVGAVPLVRMCWRSDTFSEAQAQIISPEPMAPSAQPEPSTSSSLGSFFEQRVIPPSASPSPQTSPVPIPPMGEAPRENEPSPTQEISARWTGDALARFKKMPNLAKRY